MFSSGLNCSTAACLLLVLTLQPVLAQSDDPQIEQILVTARKRSELPSQVDISMNVVDSGAIAAFQLRTLPELVSQTQNVAMFEDFPGAGIPTWVIRGVGLQDFNSNNTPTAAVYADGVYQSATVMGGAGLFDIDQVEILKGPQGGLYGRNTTGGAVLLNSQRAKPGLQQESLSVGVDSWRQATLQGMVNLPIGSDDALRLAANVESGGEGWQRSIPTGQRHGVTDRYDLRSWLHWNFDNQWQLDWKLQGGSDKSDITLGRSIGLFVPASPPAFCPAVLAGKRDDLHCINFGGVNLIAEGKADLVENLAWQSANGSTVFSSPLNKQDNHYVGTLVELDWQGATTTFKSITALDRFDYGVALDMDGSAGEYGHRISSSNIDQITQELQLLSSPGAALAWMTGLSVSDEEFSESRDFNGRDNFLVPLGQGKLGYRQATKSQSAYFDMSYQLDAQWRLSGNIRYTHEQKHYRDGNFYLPGTTPFYFVSNLAADYNLDHHLSGSAGLEYQPGKDTLVYSKISSGFKSGGFYGGFPFNAIEITPYQAETLLAYEVGLKQWFPVQQLQFNLSAFSYDYRNVQGFVRDINPITGTGIDHLANMADARHYGAEMEIDWYFLSGWELRTMLGWLDAKFVNASKPSTGVSGQQSLAEGQRPYAPRWSGNIQLSHKQPIGGDYLLSWDAAYNFQSDATGHQPTPIDAAVNHLPGYGKLDASVALTTKDSPWQLQLWVKNLADKIYRTRVKDDGLNSYIEFFGEPRTAGLSITFHH